MECTISCPEEKQQQEKQQQPTGTNVPISVWIRGRCKQLPARSATLVLRMHGVVERGKLSCGDNGQRADRPGGGKSSSREMSLPCARGSSEPRVAMVQSPLTASAQGEHEANRPGIDKNWPNSSICCTMRRYWLRSDSKARWAIRIECSVSQRVAGRRSASRGGRQREQEQWV